MSNTKPSLAKAISRDPGVGLYSVARVCWVECPTCGNSALVRPVLPWSARGKPSVSCKHCGHSEALSNRCKIGATGRVACGCFRCGQSLPQVHKGIAFHGRLRSTIRCLGCGAVGEYELYSQPPEIVDGVDPSFGYPLYLKTSVGSEELWALNPAHLSLLQGYLGAGLRKRNLGDSNMTMMARLPRWMKAAKNRNAVLAGLARLERKAKTLA